ncbi:MAG: alpha/beta hydrolase [Cyclobacteriaceae bacterium]|nr:alpha/beta hydrolase [Cyclobacteriaceae bacterium]MDH5251177.1 alpha/beta hydrolase [Cyclobacteriaceae bacterium]
MNKRFATFLTLTLIQSFAYSQDVNFGSNKEIGKYVKVKDASIYYETYGTGKPLILLHGGPFGHISNFSEIIPKLSKNYKVIAIDTRGHGRSEIGERAFTYDLLADDVYQVLKEITNEKVIVIGYSDGGLIGFKFATKYPELVNKVICLSGIIFSPKDYRENAMKGLESQTGDFFEKELPELVNKQKALMPEPTRWNDFVEKLKSAWLNPIYFNESEVLKSKFPLLIICGDRDEWVSLETIIKNYRRFNNAQISVIPNCGHELLERTDELLSSILPFLKI